MKLKIKRVRPYAQVPKQATAGSAGSDLYAALEEPLSIPAGAIRSIPTGIAAEPDTDSVALLIFPRSGLASKHGITLANAIGLTATIGAKFAFRSSIWEKKHSPLNQACALHNWLPLPFFCQKLR